MQKRSTVVEYLLRTVNFDALRCTIAPHCSARDIVIALKRQYVIDREK